MFKKNREKRFDKLVAVGFVHFEAQYLSMIPFAKHPAMAEIIRRRRKLYEKRIREADKKGWSRVKRQRIWNIRTKKMYQRRGWICRTDHPSGMGPHAGEPNPFELYRHYERSEINPLPGDSRKPADRRSEVEKRWQLDRSQIVLLRARQAKEHADWEKYTSALLELDEIIEHSSGTKREQLTAAKHKIERRRQ
ncbi:MAG: hypothetical protein WCF70_07575 [Dehalococcoidales bacterium]